MFTKLPLSSIGMVLRTREGVKGLGVGELSRMMTALAPTNMKGKKKLCDGNGVDETRNLISTRRY